MEILTFYGDFHDQTTGELKTNKMVTVVDRSMVVQEEDIPSWLGHAPISMLAGVCVMTTCGVWVLWTTS